MANVPELLTPEQTAEYLQINRETVYRYIRSGKLVASRLGKSYRIPRRSIDLLLWATRTAPGVPMREYSTEEVAEFLEADRLDDKAMSIVERFTQGATEGAPADRRQGRRGAAASR